MTRTSMTCDRFDDLLADYFEGTSEAGTRSAMDAHRGECLRCAALVRDIDKIRADAEALPELTPSRDLWDGISERIDREVVAAPVFGAPHVFTAPALGTNQPKRRTDFMKWGVAAAVLIAVTSGVTYYATMARVRGTVAMAPQGVDPQATIVPNRPESASSTSPNVIPLSSEQPPATLTGTSVLPAGHAARQSAMVTYDREIADLRNVLAQRRGDLDPSTVAILEHSLTTIDGAIQEARTALASDPASKFLKDQLDKALEKKLGLLRTVALLPARA